MKPQELSMPGPHAAENHYNLQSAFPRVGPSVSADVTNKDGTVLQNLLLKISHT